MPEPEEKIVITVICYDVTPEQVARHLVNDMPRDGVWYSIGNGEFEITAATVVDE